MSVAEETPWVDIIGVDVAKDWIDVHWLSTGQAQRLATTRPALARFARAARGGLVVLEASGGYERPLLEALARAGVAYARVNPARARDFARAKGWLAKTDRLDARTLARMAGPMELEPSRPADPERVRLADLVARRDDLGGLIRSERNRLGQARDAGIRRGIASLLKVLGRHLAKVTAVIEALVQTDPALAAPSRRLRSLPGLGPTLAATLLARLPELGRLTRRQIASLAGLAPHACDSGLHRGQRHIRGGRAEVRRALYLAAFVASRYDPTFKAFRARLQAQGKPTKLALTATARKLLTTLNAMLRDGSDYRPQPA